MEKFFLSNTTIKSFLNSFTQDQKLKVLQYLSIIGIEYIANFSNDSADLFSVLKNIASFLIFFFENQKINN